MNFQWIKSSTTNPTITLYANNVTLNNASKSYFENSKYCMLGIDNDLKAIAIKPILPQEMGRYDATQLNKISLGKGYARICNKTFIDEVNRCLEIDSNGLKLEASFDEMHQMLIAKLKEGEKVT